jgi:uncharacterized membrane protein
MNVDADNMPPGPDEVTSDDRLWALLGYLFPLIALIVLLMEGKKDRPFIRWHAVTALMLAVITFILSITACLWVLPYGYGIFLGVQAYQSSQWSEAPFLTDFAQQQGWIAKPGM